MEPSPYKSVEENILDTIYTELEKFIDHSWDRIELQREDDFESKLVYFEDASSITIDVDMVIDRGISAHHVITEYASENSDIVVMATHGHSGLAHVFLGSTAEQVARHIRCRS